MSVNEFNDKKSEQFAGQLVETLNHGALSLMLSLGHRTGLFDALRDSKPATSEEISRAANLNERYVREWLGSMVTGKVMEYDPEQKTYFLPPEHAAWLSRQSPEGNIAVFAQYISQLGTIEEEILACFKSGGGVPYSSFKRFHEIMEEDSGQSIVPVIVDQVVPMMDGMKEALQSGVEVLDIGCGRGRALQELAKAFPKSRFVGYDLSEEAVSHATQEASRKGLTNISYQAQDVSKSEAKDRFHLILALDAIHDQAHPRQVLKNVHQALHPSGSFMMQDISGSSHVHKNVDHPLGTLLYTISCLHCMTVSLEQGGEGLGAMWGIEKAQEMLEEAGFKNIKINRLDHDIQNCYFVAKK